MPKVKIIRVKLKVPVWRMKENGDIIFCFIEKRLVKNTNSIEIEIYGDSLVEYNNYLRLLRRLNKKIIELNKGVFTREGYEEMVNLYEAISISMHTVERLHKGLIADVYDQKIN